MANVDNEARHAHEAAQLGDFVELDRLLDASPLRASEGPWAQCLRMARWLALPEGPPPAVDVRILDEPREQRAGRIRACADRLLAAVLALDASKVQELAGAQAALALDEGDAAWAQRALLWARWLGGDDVSEGAAELARSAASSGVARLVIEGTVLGALSALEEGDFETALSAARRGARMARAEAIVQHEYLSGLTLARVRRRGGHPALAARILASLAQVAPASWDRWLEWEMGFAAVSSRASAVSSALRAALGAAREGDRASLANEVEKLERHAAGVRSLEKDLAGLVDALDVSREPSGPSSGELCLLPLENAWGSGADSSAAHVWVHPDGRARRILASGVGLLETPPQVVESPTRRDARVPQLLTALAARAGEPASEAEIFREVYGFAFVREKHDGVLRVVIHRARAQLEDAGDLVRDGGSVQLRVRRPLLIPDPRAGGSIEERVMHFLGSAGGSTSPKAVAEALGIQLRAAQRALRKLLDDGACEAQGKGRGVLYRLEDTTFVEPTRSRVTPFGRS